MAPLPPSPPPSPTLTTPSKGTTSPNLILAALNKCSVILPDLPAIQDPALYPLSISPHLEHLRRDVDTWLAYSMSHASPKRLQALRSADFAYFGATWWPQAPYPRLRILTFLAVWVFTWDDELDESTGSLFHTTSSEAAELYRADTRDYIRCCLGLSSTNIGREPTSPIIQNFEIIGTAIRAVYDREQCARLAHHIESYIQGCRVEERLRAMAIAPTVQQYWNYRLRSSAVCVTLAMQEYAVPGMRLARSVMESQEMRELWMRANLIISTVNDLLSLKKELRGGNVASMVPLLWAEMIAAGEGGDVQDAVDETETFLLENVEGFEDASERVLRCNKSCTVNEAKMLRQFVNGVRSYISGNLSWSLMTPRYGISEDDLIEGREIVL